MITEYEAMQVGKEIAALCGLKLNKEGRVKTAFGDKTLVGLGRCVERVVIESLKDVREVLGEDQGS